MASGARDQHAKPMWTRSSGGKQAGSLIAAVRGAPEAVPERRGGERRGAADVLLEVADVGGLSANSTLHLVKVAQLNGGQGHKIKRNAFKVPVYWSHTDFLRGRGLSEGGCRNFSKPEFCFHVSLLCFPASASGCSETCTFPRALQQPPSLLSGGLFGSEPFWLQDSFVAGTADI